MKLQTGPLAIVIISCLFLAGTLLVVAQDSSAPGTQQAALDAFYVAASEACIGRLDGVFCNGGLPPVAEPDGPVNNSLASFGALVEVGVVDAIRTPPFAADCSTGGLFWMRVTDTRISGVLVGDVSLRDMNVPDFPAWQSLVVETAATEPGCPIGPRNSFVMQNSVFGQATRVVINGVSLNLNGTVMVITRSTEQSAETLFLTLDGQLQVIALGQTQGMVAGQQVSVPYTPGNFAQPANIPSTPAPYDSPMVGNFPVALLDRPALLPQPGYVETQGTVNLRSSPSISAGIIREVGPGEIMTILGRNTAGDWYNVRLSNSQTGWMFADNLERNHGEITAVYEDTPVPPQRYGPVGYTARVISQDGVSMYDAPDLSFNAIAVVPQGQEVFLLARSPYSLWVQVDSTGLRGWLPLISLESQAIIESLPVNYDVPPLPLPTLVPGSWGNAFPDPNCYPNC